MARRTAVLNEKLSVEIRPHDQAKVDAALQVLSKYGLTPSSGSSLRTEGVVPEEFEGLTVGEIANQLVEEFERVGAVGSIDPVLGEQYWIDSVSVEGAVGRPK